MRRFVFVFILLFLPAVALAGKMIKVKVQRSTVFQGPRFFAEVVASVEYGGHENGLDP